MDSYPNQALDSTYTKDERFEFQGVVDFPKYCKIVINPTPNNTDNTKLKLCGEFFLDNSCINVSCVYDNLPSIWYESPSKRHHVKIESGPKANDLYLSLIEKNRAYLHKASVLREEYLKTYHVPSLSGVFNTEEGIRIIRELCLYNDSIFNNKVNFIKDNYNSIVSLRVAQEILDVNSKLTITGIDSIVSIFDARFEGTEPMKSLKSTVIAAKKFALGERFKNAEFENEMGEKKQLSDYIKTGEYSFIEFWASWCGPCRGEIPHLKNIHQEYGNNINIVSISIDSDNYAWKKALKEEKMKWTQLCGERSAREYGIRGVPFCVILDKKGNIIGKGIRGAEIDNLLRGLFK